MFSSTSKDNVFGSFSSLKHVGIEDENTVEPSLSYQLSVENHINSSSINHQTNDSTYHDYGIGVVVTLAIIMVICMVLALIGNFLVILTVIRHKGMRTRTNMFIVNLAIADILVAIFNMPFSLTTVISGDWIFGDTLCQFNGFVTPLFLITSIHTLMHISIHKYISITKPFSQTMTNRKILVMISLGWIWASICALTTLKFGNYVLYKKGASQCGPSIPDELNEYIHSIMITTFNYILPLVVMIYCYFRIFREIHEHMTRIRQTSNMDLQNTLTQQRKITGTLFSVLACFLICWTPFIAYSCSAAFVEDKSRVPLLANPVAYWCGYMNSACNPIIYALRSPSFRQGYKEIICHYQTYNVGGSLVTRPSLSPYGTIKKLSSRLSNGLLSSTRNDSDKTLAAVQRRLLSNKLKAEEIMVQRYRTKNKKAEKVMPALAVSLQTGIDRKAYVEENNTSTGGQKMCICSCPDTSYSAFVKNSNSPVTELDSIDSKFPFSCKRHSFPSCSDDELIRETCIHSSIQKQDSCNDKTDSDKQNSVSASVDSINKYTDQSNTDDTDDQQTISKPVVVIDATSLVSSSQLNLDDPVKNSFNLSPILKYNDNDWYQNLATVSGSKERNPGNLSPISTRSLDMTKQRHNNRRMSSKSKSSDVVNAEFLTISAPQSPLYSASKEQLMKWMSEDNLDQLQGNLFSFGLGANLFSSIRNLGRHHHKFALAESRFENEKVNIQKI